LDYSNLKARIKERVGSVAMLTRLTGLGYQRTARILKGSGEFSYKEMQSISQALSIRISEWPKYFFKEKV